MPRIGDPGASKGTGQWAIRDSVGGCARVGHNAGECSLSWRVGGMDEEREEEV